MVGRALVHLVASGDTDLASLVSAGERPVTVLRRDPDCFHGDSSPFAAALEAHTDDLDALVDAMRTIDSWIDRERSMAIVGTDRVFIEPAAPTSVRYQYLMHRREDFTHAAYLARYESIHAEFGLRTPHIEGYTQLHVDLDSSREFGERIGALAPPCDSMSELYLESVAHFVDGILAHPEVGHKAQEDEERFVDRERSFGFAHRVV